MKSVQLVDVVIDSVGGNVLKQSFSVVRKGGTVVTLIDFESIKLAASYGVHGKTVFALPNAEQLAQIANLLEQRILKPHVTVTFPLFEVIKAHQFVETGHVRGKVVLEV